MTDCVFQPARAADAPTITRMSRRLIESGLEPSWPAERVLRHIQHPESVVLSAKAGGELLGFAIMQFADESAHLNLLAVEPVIQRRGIGARMLEWLEGTAITAGTFVIQLELRATNRGALAFYEKACYRQVVRIPGYYQRIEDAIRMEKDLRVVKDIKSPC